MSHVAMSTSGVAAIGDWTTGMPQVVYQHCLQCSAAWYFARGFCPRCGSTGPERLVASGRGHVHAVTQVLRAPTPALSALAPYTVLLVDAAEGFRLMAHGDAALRIGDAVRAEFRRFGDALVPYFEVDAAASRMTPR